jgi:hypothetical protein
MLTRTIRKVTGKITLSKMDKIETTTAILGIPGRMISNSKSAYKEKYPHHLVIFNSNLCTSDYKIWWGDLDLTKSQNELSSLAEALGEDIYVLYELDGRFEHENKPLTSKFAVKFFYDGGLELSKQLKEIYTQDLVKK